MIIFLSKCSYSYQKARIFLGNIFLRIFKPRYIIENDVKLNKNFPPLTAKFQKQTDTIALQPVKRGLMAPQSLFTKSTIKKALPHVVAYKSLHCTY